MFKIGDLVERVRNPQQTAELQRKRGDAKTSKIVPKFGKPYRVVDVNIVNGVHGVVLGGLPSCHPTGGFAAGYFRKIERADEAFIMTIKARVLA